MTHIVGHLADFNQPGWLIPEKKHRLKVLYFIPAGIFSAIFKVIP